MFRNMRRSAQQLSEEETRRILREGTTGVLAVMGDEGYPYTVPVNYAIQDGKILFHGAKAGHKFDAIIRNEKASFCVIDHDEVVPDEVTDYYRSAVVFGRVHLIEDDAEKTEAALALGRRFSPEEAVQADMNRSYAKVAMFAMTIEFATGKANKKLILRDKG